MSARTKKTLFFLTLMCVPILGIAQTYIPSGGLEILNNLGETVATIFDTGNAEFDGDVTANKFIGDGSELTGVGVTPEFITGLTPATPVANDLIFGVDDTDGQLKQFDIGDIIGAGGGLVDGATLTSGLTFPNTGLEILDTNASHTLTLRNNFDLTADRTLNIVTGDADRTLTLSGNSTISGSNLGDVTLAGSYDYITISGQVITRGQIDLGTDITGSLDIDNIAATGTPSDENFLRGDGTWAPADSGVPGGVSDGDTLTSGLTFPNVGLAILDTDSSHTLTLRANENLTVNRTLNLILGGVNRSLTLTADASIGGTNTGDISLSGAPDYLSLAGQTLTLNKVDIDDLDATGTPSGTTYLRGDGTWSTPAGSSGIEDGDTLSTGLTFPNIGLHLLDTNASHDLIIAPGSDLSADRTLTINTGDLNRSLTLSADATVGGTNSGDISLSGTPDYLSIAGQVLTVNKVDIDDLDTTGTASSSVFLRGDGAWTAISGGDPTYGSAGGAADNAVYVDADNQLGLGTLTPSSSIHIYDETLPPTITYQFFSESGGDVTAYPATKAYSTPGGQIWTGETNIGANDSTYAGSIAFSANTTQTLKGTNLSFSLPVGATVDGIEVDVDVKCNNAFGLDYGAYLIIGGTVQTGTNKAVGTALNTSDTVITYGGPLDDWGGVTRDQVNATDFGFAWRGEFTAGATISVDYITITIYYTELGGDHTWATGISTASGAFVFRENATDHVTINKTTGDTEFLGDVTASAFIGDGSGLTGISTTPADGSITNAKLANMVEATIKGRASGAGTGAPTDLSASQVRAILNVADGATANAGTVTSVAVSGSDGIEIDSGSPITTDGTIALGVNASTLYAHLISTASTVTPTTSDSLLISDASASGAIAEVSLANIMLAVSGSDNAIYKVDGSNGQPEKSGVYIDDSNAITGVASINGMTAPNVGSTIATTSSPQTFTQKLIQPRETTDNTSPTDINATDYDQVVIVMSGGNYTVNAPTSPPFDGKEILYRFKQATVGGPFTVTWNGVFRSPDSWGLSNAIPGVSTTAGTWDYYLFIWNDDIDKWDLLATTAPLS